MVNIVQQYPTPVTNKLEQDKQEEAAMLPIGPPPSAISSQPPPSYDMDPTPIEEEEAPITSPEVYNTVTPPQDSSSIYDLAPTPLEDSQAFEPTPVDQEEFNYGMNFQKQVEGISEEEVARAEQNIQDMNLELGYGGYRLDTGIPLSSISKAMTGNLPFGMQNIPGVKGAQEKYEEGDLPAFLIGVGDMLRSSVTGAGQILDNLGLGPYIGFDKEAESTDARSIRALGGSEKYGASLAAGQVTGALTEPVGLLLPGAKGATVGKMVAKGSALGATIGFLDYVDEETEETRIKNAGIGTLLGAGLSYGVAKISQKFLTAKVAKQLEAVPDVVGHNPKTVEEAQILDTFEELAARELNSGTPEERVLGRVAKQEPELFDKARKIYAEYNEKPNFQERASNLLLESEVERTGGSADVIANTVDRIVTKVGGAPLEVHSEMVGGVKRLTGLIGRRVQEIAPRIHAQMMKLETRVKVHPEKLGKYVEEFASYFPTHSGRVATTDTVKFTETQVETLKGYLLNGEFGKAEGYLKDVGGTDAVKAFKKVVEMYKREGAELVEAGILHKDTLLDNYWARVILPDQRENYLRDLKAIIESRGGKKYGEIPDLMEKYNKHLENVKKSFAAKGRTLSAYDESQIFYSFFMHDPTYKLYNSNKANRQLKTIPKQLLKYYADPIAATHSWIHRMSRERGVLDMIGLDAYKAGDSKIAESGVFDVEEAMNQFMSGKKTAQYIADITDIDARREVVGLMKLRLGEGLAKTSQSVKWYKALVNSFLLGNPATAMLQLADLSASAYRYNLKTSAKGIAAALSRDSGKKLTIQDFGLERIAQEFEDVADAGWFTKLQDFTFRWSGFNSADKLGKETILNTSLKYHVDAVKNPGGKEFARFRRKYEAAWGDDFKSLVKDLKEYGKVTGIDKEKITDNMKTLLLTEISGLQPVTALNQTEFAARSNYGKFFWTLKSFMLQQLDIIRGDIYNEAKTAFVKGDKEAGAEAARNLIRFVGFVGMGNYTVYQMREVLKGNLTFQDLKDSAGSDQIAYTLGKSMLHSLKLFNIDEYMFANMKNNGLLPGVAETFLPPLPIVDPLLQEARKKNPDYANRLIESLPGVGAMIKAQHKREKNSASTPAYAEGGEVKDQWVYLDKAASSTAEMLKTTYKANKDLMKGLNIATVGEDAYIMPAFDKDGNFINYRDPEIQASLEGMKQEGLLTPYANVKDAQEDLPDFERMLDDFREEPVKFAEGGGVEPQEDKQPSLEERVASTLGVKKEDLMWAKGMGDKWGNNAQGHAAKNMALGWLASKTSRPDVAKTVMNVQDFVRFNRDADLPDHQVENMIDADTKLQAEQQIHGMVEDKNSAWTTKQDHQKLQSFANGGDVKQHGIYQDDYGSVFVVGDKKVSHVNTEEML